MPNDIEHLAEIKLAWKAFTARRELYRERQRYYEGDHDLKYASRNFVQKYGSVFKNFADNLCGLVVDIVSGRIHINTVKVSGNAGDESEAIEAWMDEVDFEQLQINVHEEALIAGDAYVIVWDDGNGPRPYFQEAALVTPVYDPDDASTMLCAVKAWRSIAEGKPITRVSIYYPNRVDRYFADMAVTSGTQTRGAKTQFSFEALLPFSVDGEDPSQTHDFGEVPVIHFPYRAKPGQFGRSEITAIRPLQDAANKMIFDLLVTSEHTSFIQRWVTGIDVEKDTKTGEAKNPFEGKQLWVLGGETAKVGQLPSGDPGPVIAGINDFRAETARVASVPLYYFQHGQFPSGEAMKTAEAPFKPKIRKGQSGFNGPWRKMFALSFGVKPSNVTVVWEDMAPKSDLDEVLVAEGKSRLGVPNSQLQVELGYSEKQIKTMSSDMEKQTAQGAAQRQADISRGPQV